ncbi:cysteine proteinase [Canariomyces notabilis]|uniref:ubiquitinyl hydrolase 1 n=1 Tax=Canariomyces notabilis TaxID=2074819 RepID=A0AAN6QDI8_9PEZI|nr:cysteine proteinase [Canariomyces arenarius]
MASGQAAGGLLKPADQENDDDLPLLPVRRSSRVRKQPVAFADDVQQPSISPTSATVRRNPKRKAAPEVFDIPDNLLEASLGPWKEDEQSEWPSWTELESDPAFFTAIMAQIGVKGAKIEEVLSVEGDFLASLPQPVYGLVFLYEYVEEPSDVSTETSEDLWFANQTTNNACATIALMNIVMNAEGLALGQKLRKFKQDSMGLSPPLRGNLITNSAWIRTAHNSFARRLDLLNAALSLQNAVDKRKRLKARTSQSKKTKLKGGKSTADSAYHFVAFVPVGRKVWQLDGLRAAPQYIGEFAEGEHWTSVMCPVLEERMKRCGNEQLSFSLLALCGDDLSGLRRQLAANVRSLEELQAKLHKLPSQPAADDTADMDIICSSADNDLSAYQIDAEDIQSLSDAGGKTLDTELSCSDPSDKTVEAWREFRKRLVDEQKVIRSEYETRLKFSGQEPSKVLGRTKDHTAAIHEWVKKLADHGVLKELHEETTYS